MAIDDDAPDREISQPQGPMRDAPSDTDHDSSAISEDFDESPADSEEPDAEDEHEDAAESKPRSSRMRAASWLAVTIVLALAGLNGWLGFQTYESHKADEQRLLFLQVGRQGALNLTTIDYKHAEADIQRILDSATGTFYDDFDKRSKPFVEVVKQAQATSVGTITEAGLESETGNEAQVLVAVSVHTTNAGAAEQTPRAWRMRISVTKVGNQAKVSNVVFVP